MGYECHTYADSGDSGWVGWEMREWRPRPVTPSVSSNEAVHCYLYTCLTFSDWAKSADDNSGYICILLILP